MVAIPKEPSFGLSLVELPLTNGLLPTSNESDLAPLCADDGFAMGVGIH